MAKKTPSFDGVQCFDFVFGGFNPNVPMDRDICYGPDTQVFPIAINRQGRMDS